jgi:hypothetical protein
MSTQPIALQLRSLQTLLELGASASNTIIFPVPLDLINSFIARSNQGSGQNGGESS